VAGEEPAVVRHGRAGLATLDVVAVVSSDVTHAQSSTTLTDVTGLGVAVCATSTEVYTVEVQLILTAAAANPDWKFGWTFPSGMTGFWGTQSNVAGLDHWGPGTAPGGTQSALLVQTDALSVASSAVTGGLRIFGTFSCASTSGTLQLQFAQAASHASDLTVKRGSTLIARRVLN
jgi:hypothetical protein